MKYQKVFVRILEQDEMPVAPVAEPAPTHVDNKAAVERAEMAKTLDKGITPKDYDVPVPRTTQSDQLKHEQVEELKVWISEIDNFIEFLNAPNRNSIQSKLHAAGCDTMFDDIARSEKKKISRLAAELSSLSESLKGYLISSNV